MLRGNKGCSKFVIKFILMPFIFMLGMSASFLATAAITVGDISGYVTATNKDGEVKRLKSGDTLNEGDVVNTGNDSSVTILTDGGTVLASLGALASYAINSELATSDKFAPRTLNGKSPTLSTGTSAGGGIGNSPEDEIPDPNPGDGGSPI